MVKQLLDLCVEVVAGNLHCITGPSRYLAVRHKEKILEHLINHDNLTKEYLPHITYNLFTAGLRTLKLYYSDQVTDNLLCLLRDCKCKFENLTIHGCNNVTGKLEILDMSLRKITFFVLKAKLEMCTGPVPAGPVPTFSGPLIYSQFLSRFFPYEQFWSRGPGPEVSGLAISRFGNILTQ